jgi:uncharacterized protein
MQLDNIISALVAIKPVLQLEGVTHLEVFGSQARGEAGPKSDLDVLIDVDPSHQFSILDLVGVEHLIEDATGIPANAFMQRSLDRAFLESIFNDKIKVF